MYISLKNIIHFRKPASNLHNCNKLQLCKFETGFKRFSGISTCTFMSFAVRPTRGASCPECTHVLASAIFSAIMITGMVEPQIRLYNSKHSGFHNRYHYAITYNFKCVFISDDHSICLPKQATHKPTGILTKKKKTLKLKKIIWKSFIFALHL